MPSSQFKSPWRTSLSASSLPSGPCNHHRSGKRLIWRAEGRDFAARCAGPPRSLRGRGCGPGSKWRPRAKEESVEETIARLITVACALTAHDAAAHAPRPLFLSWPSGWGVRGVAAGEHGAIEGSAGESGARSAGDRRGIFNQRTR